MGGVWGLASATALENLPVEARGLASGVIQVGHPVGYLIAAVINLYVVPHSSHTWRALFWTSAGLSAFAALIQAIVPESGVFRLTIIIFVVFAGAFIPLWILPNTFSVLSAGAFWLQFGVWGAWGVIPIQLAEMSPPGFRATFPGVTYQLGNIEAIGGEPMKTKIIKDGKRVVVPDYARVQGILVGIVAAYILFFIIIGPENHGSNFEQQGTAFSEGVSDRAPADQRGVNGEGLSETQMEKIKEKV